MTPLLTNPTLEGQRRKPENKHKRTALTRITTTLSWAATLATGLWGLWLLTASFPPEIKRRIKERDNYTCRNCGAYPPPPTEKSEDESSLPRIRLQVAHINHHNGRGYEKKWNGRTLCIKCHTIEHIHIALYQIAHNKWPWINPIIAQLRDILRVGIYHNDNMPEQTMSKLNFEESIAFINEIAPQLAQLGIVIRQIVEDKNNRLMLRTLGGKQAEKARKYYHFDSPLQRHLTVTARIYDTTSQNPLTETFHLFLTRRAQRALQYYNKTGSPDTSQIPRLDYHPNDSTTLKSS